MTGVALAVWPAPAFAQTPPEPRARADQEGVFSLVVENDSLSSGAVCASAQHGNTPNATPVTNAVRR